MTRRQQLSPHALPCTTHTCISVSITSALNEGINKVWKEIWIRLIVALKVIDKGAHGPARVYKKVTNFDRSSWMWSGVIWLPPGRCRQGPSGHVDPLSLQPPVRSEWNVFEEHLSVAQGNNSKIYSGVAPVGCVKDVASGSNRSHETNDPTFKVLITAMSNERSDTCNFKSTRSELPKIG